MYKNERIQFIFRQFYYVVLDKFNTKRVYEIELSWYQVINTLHLN